VLESTGILAVDVMIKNNLFINYDLLELCPIPTNIHESITSYFNKHGFKEYIISKKRTTSYSDEQTRIYSNNLFPGKIIVSTVELRFKSDKFPDSVALNITDSDKKSIGKFDFKDFQEFLLKNKK